MRDNEPYVIIAVLEDIWGVDLGFTHPTRQLSHVAYVCGDENEEPVLYDSGTYLSWN